VNFSLTLQTNPKLRTAIDGIDETMWTPVRYPGAVLDTDTGRWISAAEVAETEYTAFETSNTELPTVEADLTHRAHAIIEQLFADLIDGPA
jgi:hypothetical protein